MATDHKAKPGTITWFTLTKISLLILFLELIEFQHYVTKCVLKFLKNYSKLLFHLDGSSQNPDLLEMLTVGKSVADSIRFLRRSYSDDDEIQV